MPGELLAAAHASTEGVPALHSAQRLQWSKLRSSAGSHHVLACLASTVAAAVVLLTVASVEGARAGARHGRAGSWAQRHTQRSEPQALHVQVYAMDKRLLDVRRA